MPHFKQLLINLNSICHLVVCWALSKPINNCWVVHTFIRFQNSKLFWFSKPELYSGLNQSGFQKADLLVYLNWFHIGLFPFRMKMLRRACRVVSRQLPFVIWSKFGWLDGWIRSSRALASLISSCNKCLVKCCYCRRPSCFFLNSAQFWVWTSCFPTINNTSSEIPYMAT